MNEGAARYGTHRGAFEKNKKKIYHTQRVCGICGKPVDFKIKYPSPLAPCIDHIIPISKGGHPSDIDNLQLAHWTCNRQKSDKLIENRIVDQTADVISNRILPRSLNWKNFNADGDFCLQLKKNHRAAFEDVELLFDDLKENSTKEYAALVSYSEMLKDHGRIEERTYRLLTDEASVKAALDPKWKHVACIGEARLKRTRNGQTSEETHYHLLSREMSADEYGRLARGHWEIENKLYWILDIHFKEDASTANSGNSIANLALLRKIAFNFTKLDGTMKKMIDFMTDLELFKRFVFEVIPENA